MVVIPLSRKCGTFRASKSCSFATDKLLGSRVIMGMAGPNTVIDGGRKLFATCLLVAAQLVSGY